MTSKIKVDNIADQDDNNIINESGDVITVGAAGDTVAVAGNIVKSNAYQASDGGNIISQSGTTVTLGASGDTISLASGASQSGFGRTGTVDWQTGSIKTSGFTAASGEGYFCNTTSSAFTATLPSSPSAGDIVAFKDYAQTFATNNLTVGRGGSNIEGAASDITVDGDAESITLVYVDGTKGWVLVNESSSVYGQQYVAATGGNTTLTVCNHKVHIFTGPGTFCVSNAGNSAGSNTVEYLVVAGGGGAGGAGTECGGSKVQGGGAGGGGGWRSFTALCGASPLNGPAALPVSVQGYPITVGAGGAGDPSNSSGGSRGANSIFSTITSTGGGGGGSKNTPIPSSGANKPGGSGGGGAGQPDPACRMDGGTGNTPPVSPPQGNNGGRGASRAAGPNSCSGAGGGGGAGGEGVVAPNCSIPGGAGGDGEHIPSPFIGPTAPSYGGGDPAGRVFAAGGGGGAGGGPPVSTPQGGAGGGGNGGTATTSPQAGAANTGGGAGGPHTQSSTAGGSGIVMIRYKFQ